MRLGGWRDWRWWFMAQVRGLTSAEPEEHPKLVAAWSVAGAGIGWGLTIGAVAGALLGASSLATFGVIAGVVVGTFVAMLPTALFDAAALTIALADRETPPEPSHALHLFVRLSAVVVLCVVLAGASAIGWVIAETRPGEDAYLVVAGLGIPAAVSISWLLMRVAARSLLTCWLRPWGWEMAAR
jgi:hypothetical protein